MKILFVAPKFTKMKYFDLVLWNFFIPLKQLGHEVEFHNTALETEQDFACKIDSYKPDLVFCVLTGDPIFGKLEPWESLEKLTSKGVVKTFNWFCDDAWRYEKWSRHVCETFFACSTTEPDFVNKYRNIGYDNIEYFNWHSNKDLYNIYKCPKEYEVSFIGALYPERLEYLNFVKKEDPNLFSKIFIGKNLSFEEMIFTMNKSLISLSFSGNPNGHGTKQMKGRMFEIPASNSLLLTEYTDKLEQEFIPNKEAVFFSTKEEFLQKLQKLLSKPNITRHISQNGYDKYLEKHTSEKRMKDLIEWIKSL